MMTSTFEIVSGMLFVSGSLDRGSDDELTQALEKYAQSSSPSSRVVDMSNVRWLSPSGAKVLIAAGQEAGEKGGSMRILASRHVLQTLNLLGAKTWLTIESCMTPNPKPHSPETEPEPEPEPPPSAPKAAAPATKGESAPKAESPPAASHEARAHAPAASSSSSSASTSGAMAAVRATGALAGQHEELSRGGQLLRVLHPNRRYSFHFTGGEMILGLVRERVGGSWVIVETAGTRKIINLDLIEYCEVL